MSKIIYKIRDFFKKETVLTIAFILAIISMFFVKPSVSYINYIDFRVLGILLSLMIVMSSLQRVGIFDKIGIYLLRHTKNIRQLCMVLVIICFFSSMFITNDVALITFVPFAIFTLKKVNREDKLIFVIVLQTISANLGSMLMPTGNPQNLYLYNISSMSFFGFIKIMLPYTILSFIFIVISVIIFCGGDSININQILTSRSDKEFTEKEKLHTIVYIILFVCGILSVCRILPYYILLGIVLISVIICDVKALVNVDYCLIFTFICFFVFIGNMGNIEFIKNTLENAVQGNELLIGVLSSQVISNVPAALMLSGFTSNYETLLIGVNIGGLGTIIASMASLISYKAYAHNYNNKKDKYLLFFTAANIVFLVLLYLLNFIIDI